MCGQPRFYLLGVYNRSRDEVDIEVAKDQSLIGITVHSDYSLWGEGATPQTVNITLGEMPTVSHAVGMVDDSNACADYALQVVGNIADFLPDHHL